MALASNINNISSVAGNKHGIIGSGAGVSWRQSHQSSGGISNKQNVAWHQISGMA